MEQKVKDLLARIKRLGSGGATAEAISEVKELADAVKAELPSEDVSEEDAPAEEEQN